MKTNTSQTIPEGQTIKVKLLDGTDGEIKVNELTIGQWQEAFKLFTDEIALTAFICGREKTGLGNVSPASYTALLAAAQQVNLHFFGYAGRRLEDERWSAASAAVIESSLRSKVESQMDPTAKAPASTSPPRPR